MREINKKFELKIDKVSVTVGLFNTELAEQIAAELPLTLHMEKSLEREYCSETLSFTPQTSEEKQTFFDVGDIVYWGKGNALAFFYAEGEKRDVPSGIVVIGKIISDLAALAQLPDNIQATLTPLSE